LWVLIALLCLVLLVVLVLSIPLSLEFTAATHGETKLEIRLLWLFGLVKVRVPKSAGKTEEMKKVRKQRRWGGSWMSGRDIIGMLRTRGLFRQIERLLADLFSQLRIKELSADYQIGFYDSADTGMLFAFIAPLALLLNSFSPVQLRFQPAFGDETVFKGEARGAISAYPVRVLGILMSFVLSAPVRRVIGRVIASRWKKRDWKLARL
jgi:hypothetical protein